jgi:hypothetical protein
MPLRLSAMHDRVVAVLDVAITNARDVGAGTVKSLDPTFFVSR